MEEKTHKVEEGESISLSAINKLEAKGMTCTHLPSQLEAIDGHVYNYTRS